MDTMNDYIKREDAIKAMARGLGIPYTDFIDVAERCMVDIPTADMVEVVRCKDCKFYEIYPNGANGDCINRIDAFNTFYPNDFCSYGERADT